jgi:hypothetical protein
MNPGDSDPDALAAEISVEEESSDDEEHSLPLSLRGSCYSPQKPAAARQLEHGGRRIGSRKVGGWTMVLSDAKSADICQYRSIYTSSKPGGRSKPNSKKTLKEEPGDVVKSYMLTALGTEGSECKINTLRNERIQIFTRGPGIATDTPYLTRQVKKKGIDPRLVEIVTLKSKGSV